MTTATKDKPILFSGPMVRAILDGKKIQTRRVIKPQPVMQDGAWYWRSPRYDNGMGVDYFHTKDVSGIEDAWARACPYGLPRGRLWVREAFKTTGVYPDNAQVSIEYRAGGHNYADKVKDWVRYYEKANNGRWEPSIHMPRWASRILLEVTEVRVERVQEISEEDAQAEGVGRGSFEEDCSPQDEQLNAECGYFPPRSYAGGFSYLWDTINKKRGFSWDSNPWVWVVCFKRLEP